jgi:hypothetical protein
MSKWLQKFFETEPQSNTDSTDRFNPKTNVSVLSVPPEGPLDKNLENMPDPCTDNTDRFNPKMNVSVLSVPPEGPLDENLENMPDPCTDNTDRFNSNANVSVLSVPSQGLLDKNLENVPESCTDSTDRFNSNANMSVLSVPSQGSLDKTSLLDDFEERLAIAEYDGHQTPTQAQRIAYQDAFIAALNTLPYEETEGYYDEDWLTRRIKAAQSWLVAQGLHQPK